MTEVKINDKITLYNADCMEVMAMYPDGYFDIALIDPPYRDDKDCKGTIRTAGNKQSSLAFGGRPTKEYWDELMRVSKHQVVFGANNYGIPFKGYIVWDKTNIPDRFSMSKCELASVDDKLSTVGKICHFSSSPRRGTRIHPTQKPVDLYLWILDNYAKEGWKVLDTHLGSGSSAIASNEFGCGEFVGIEIMEEFFNATVDRLTKYNDSKNEQ